MKFELEEVRLVRVGLFRVYKQNPPPTIQNLDPMMEK